MKKPILSGAVMLGMASLLAACSSQATSSTETAAGASAAPAASASAAATSGLPASCSEPGAAIGVALPDTTNPYYIAMKKGFEDAAAANGFEAKVAIANDADATQLSQIQSFIQQKVCAVALNAVNSGPAAASVVELNKAGIPVFTVNVVVDKDALATQGGEIVQYLGAGAFESGQVMGEQALKDLGADAKPRGRHRREARSGADQPS